MNAVPKHASAHRSPILAQLWTWFRLGLCLLAVPVAFVYLYSCFYL